MIFSDLTEKQTKRLIKIVEFNDKNPDKYCWPDLHDMAICEDREERLDLKESAKAMRFCKIDMENNGSCWCGKFKKRINTPNGLRLSMTFRRREA